VDDTLPVQQFNVKLKNYLEVMVGIIAGFVTYDEKKRNLILVSNLLREIMVYTVEKLGYH
jgi:hypothetical protein